MRAKQKLMEYKKNRFRSLKGGKVSNKESFGENLIISYTQLLILFGLTLFGRVLSGVPASESGVSRRVRVRRRGLIHSSTQEERVISFNNFVCRFSTIPTILYHCILSPTIPHHCEPICLYVRPKKVNFQYNFMYVFVLTSRTRTESLSESTDE